MCALAAATHLVLRLRVRTAACEPHDAARRGVPLGLVPHPRLCVLTPTARHGSEAARATASARCEQRTARAHCFDVHMCVCV